MYLSVTTHVTHVSGEVEAESEDEDYDDDDCKKGSMDEVCISQVTLSNQFKYYYYLRFIAHCCISMLCAEAALLCTYLRMHFISTDGYKGLNNRSFDIILGL